MVKRKSKKTKKAAAPKRTSKRPSARRSRRARPAPTGVTDPAPHGDPPNPISDDGDDSHDVETDSDFD